MHSPKKKDSKENKRWRIVLDFRALKEKHVGNAYPLFNIVDILDQLSEARYFSVCDLASGFHQIKINPADSHKTAFTTSFARIRSHALRIKKYSRHLSEINGFEARITRPGIICLHG